MRAVAAEKVHALCEARHQAANVARVLAERGRRDLRINDSARRRATRVTETFTPPFQALVGDDAHKQRIEARPANAHESRRSRPYVAGHADEMTLDRNDLHRGLNDPMR